MRRPTISVCIVTCNQHAYIGQCLNTVLAQEVDADVSVIVGDDASDDGTSGLVAQLAGKNPGKIRHLLRHPRMGAFTNMRDLMKYADGDFVARIDGDDYWLPGKLQLQLDYLLSHPDCSAVYTNAIAVDAEGRRIGLFNDVGDAQFDLAAVLSRGNFFNNSSVMFRANGRRAWLDVPVPQIDYRIHLWHARSGYLAHFGSPFAGYRTNANASVVANMNDRVRELYWEAIQSVPRDLVSDGDFAHGIADFMRRVSFRALSTRNARLVREWWPRVRATSPYGSLRTAMLVMASILRISGKTIMGRFRRGPDGRPLRILYRR